ncbi:MAG: hypothetical protein NTV51_05495 [Verrucomicrobia bacterium]|nr:hypothetical protein [Verrucomicrobiota bacterium]
MNNKYTSSSPVRGFRGLFRPMICTLAALVVSVVSGLRAAPGQEVMVWARVTAEGRQRPAPALERPGFYVMAATAGREIGAPWKETQAASVDAVARDVRQALGTSRYRPVDGDQAPAGSVIIVFHWGSVSPVMFETGTEMKVWMNQHEVLAVLGGPPLDRVAWSERNDLFAAAGEERYYLIVSAYEIVAGSPRPSERRLLWRTHASVPAIGLSQARAMPLLCAAGAAWFGRETRTVQKVDIEVAGTLVLAKK